MIESKKKICWFYPILLFPYGLGFYLSLINVSGFFIFKKGIAESIVPILIFFNDLSLSLSNMLPVSADILYLGMLSATILLSLILPFYCLAKNIERHFSGWLLIINLIVSAPALLLLFIGLSMNTL